MVYNEGATWNWIRGAGTIYSSLRIRRSKHCEPEDAQMSYLSMNNKDEGYLDNDREANVTHVEIWANQSDQVQP